MYRRHSNLFTLILGTCLAVAGISCRRESSLPAHAASEHASPERSFEVLVDLVKDGMVLPGGSVSGFISQSTGTSSRFQVHNTVTSELIPPATPADPYRGKITITSQSVYSLRRSAEDNDQKKKDDQNAPANRGFGTRNDSDDSQSGFNSFDKGLVSDSSDEKKPGAAEIESVQRRPDKVDRTYDLVYQNGRWELTTKLDPKTEASVENAFQRALRLQP
jgi:hypothetical protein